MSEFVCLNNWPQFTLLTLRLIWTVGQWHDILEGTIRLKKSFPQSWPRQKWSAYRDLLIVVGHFSPPAFFQSCDATSSDGIFHSFCPDANYFLRYAKPSSYSFKIKPSFIWRFSSLNKGRGNLLICVIGSRNLVDTWLLLPIMPVLLGTGTSSKGFCRTYVLRNRLLDSLFFMLFFWEHEWLALWIWLPRVMTYFTWTIELHSSGNNFDCYWPQAESVTENEMFWFSFSP